jgi:hypothetical protein
MASEKPEAVCVCARSLREMGQEKKTFVRLSACGHTLCHGVASPAPSVVNVRGTECALGVRSFQRVPVQPQRPFMDRLPEANRWDFEQLPGQEVDWVSLRVNVDASVCVSSYKCPYCRAESKVALSRPRPW